MSLFSVSKLRAESLLLSLIDVYDLCLPSMFTTTVTTKTVSSFFSPLDNLCLWNRKHEIGKTKSEANLSYFPKGGFGERSSVTAPNRFRLAKQQLCTCIPFYTFLCHFCANKPNYWFTCGNWQSPIEKWRPSSVQQIVAYMGRRLETCFFSWPNAALIWGWRVLSGGRRLFK